MKEQAPNMHPDLTQEDIDSAINALHEKPIPEAEQITEAEPLVTQEEMDEAVRALDYEQQEQNDRSKIEEVKGKLEELFKPEESHGDDGGNGIEHDEGDGGGDGRKDPVYIYTTVYKRMHGTEREIFRKVFGDGIRGFFKFLFNRKAHRLYKKMLKEYEDDSLAEITHEKELLVPASTKPKIKDMPVEKTEGSEGENK